MEEKRRDSGGISPATASTTDASPSEQPTSRRRGALKRKSASINNSGSSSNPQTTSSKRHAREKPPVVPFPPIHMNGPCTRARVQPQNSGSLSEVAAVKREVEAREAAAARAEEMIRLTENWEALEAKIEADYEAIRSRDASVHVVPIHAGWFSWTKIHPLEERMLPSFFNGKSGSRTPEIYKEIRDWIMKKFHRDLSTNIELKHLSELTVGELDARQEVMEFLDYWGLINYHPFPHQEPAAMNVDVDANNDESGKSESLIEKLFKFETVQSWTPTVSWMNMTTPDMLSGLLPEAVISDELVKSEGPSVEYHCNSCSTDCSRKRYHCQKQADFDLCAECYTNGKFGSNMSPLDFILMEPPEAGGASGGKWTDQETLLLLEAIELFRDNWSEIAEHVATKTKAQCILHFVQMPIEDAFFNHDDENNDSPKENGVPNLVSDKQSAPEDDKDNDAAVKDAAVKTESQNGSNDNQDSSCPMEISKVNEVNESDASPEAGENFALKALKEAFEAVGSLPSGDRLSLAEAGNPVMTLAAFLVRLVEPNIANASVCSLLKSLSSGYSSEQLAARHCFPLEDPPDDKKVPADAEGAADETTKHEAKKDKAENAELLEENPDFVAHDDENQGNKDSAPEENHGRKGSESKDQKNAASPRPNGVDGSDNVKEPDVMDIDKEETKPTSQSDPVSSDLAKEQVPKDAEKSSVSGSHTELQSNSTKEAATGALAGEASRSKEPMKDDDMIPVSENKETDALVVSNSTEKKDSAGDKEAKEPTAKEKHLGIDEKLKRAAVTALSAAAMKAKLLADQEDDQLLQLSTFLVEKQLYKLETKLAFFADMENVVMKVKEQLERSKQRLFHERAQIIATRFGMPGSARPPSQTLPPNKAGVALPNMAPRPFMGMNPLRPPTSRPMMPPNPTSSTMFTGNPTGNPVQPNADNKLSSVGMK